MVDAATFRTDWPEFSDSTAYPDTVVTRWLTIGASFVNVDRWGDLADFGIELFAAHNLVLWKRDSKSASAGGGAGTVERGRVVQGRG